MKHVLSLVVGVIVLVGFSAPVQAEVSVDSVCEAAVGRLSLEDNATETFLTSCRSELSGKRFDSEDVLTDEDVSDIEDSCSSKASEGEEDQYDRNFESCVIRAALDILKNR